MSMQDSVNWIDSRQQVLFEQLMQLSEINSGTQNLAGLDKIAAQFESLFAPLADEVEVLESRPLDRIDIEGNAITESFGKVLSFSKRATAPYKILLCGHMDTVFPADHLFQSPERVDPGTLRGPGVADMKGGILVMLTALESRRAAARPRQPQGAAGGPAAAQLGADTGGLRQVGKGAAEDPGRGGTTDGRM